MALLDKIILWFFSSLCVVGILWMIYSLRRSLKAASKNDEGLTMFLWAASAFTGLIIAILGAMYFVVPLLMFYSGR